MTPDILVADRPRFVRRDVAINENIEEYLDMLKKYIEDCKAFHMSSCVDSVKINVEYIDEEKEEMTQKLQNKFAVGDKVVCVRESLFSNEDFMFFGSNYIVSGCDESFVEFEGKKNYRYPVGAFVLVSPAFKNMKFRVSSPEHSKEIQEALFEMGYKWNGNCQLFKYMSSKFLYAEYTGALGVGETSQFFESLLTHQECVVETRKSYKLIPVESPKQENIEIDGKQYDKEAVLKRLAELEEVK